MSPADSPFAPLPAPGPHPATAELRAYAAGTLAPAAEHHIEAHTLDCERCADLVAGFAQTTAATTEQAVAALRTRLQARVGAEEPAPLASGWAWPRIAVAAALLGVAGASLWGWEQHGAIPLPAPTARLETTAATAPAGPVAALKSPTPAPIAPDNTKVPAPKALPQAPPTADYAVVSPSAESRRAVVRRRAWQRGGSADYARQQASSRGQKPASNEVPTTVAAADVASNTNAVAPVAAAPALSRMAVAAKKSEVSLAEKTAAPDTANPAQPLPLALADDKAIAPAQLAAGARVLNSPMPTALAINPAPVGGTPAFRDYLRREAIEFEPEKDTRMTGTVRVQFTVGADGKVSNLKVKRGLRDDYDAEALRIVCDGPAWQPGISGGRRAPLPMEVAVPF